MPVPMSPVPVSPVPVSTLPASAVRPRAHWGRVTLVGAGPGDPELLTLKAIRALERAELLLYDHLVSDAVLALAPATAERIDVGKQAARHTLPQAAICDTLVRLAQSGRHVLRLKGGDGYIFGRGGEEAQALAAAGVDFTVIPGITAAQGAAAACGIPLTHRDHAGTLVLTTGHLRAGVDVELDWAALARPRQTLVIYMGVARLPLLCTGLLAHGLAAHTPAAVVENATLPGQRCIVATLDTLAATAEAAGVRAPALIIVGEVVGLRAQIGPAADSTAQQRVAA